MTESGVSEISQQIASLRQLGADQFDPVRFHHLEVLDRRVTAHQGQVRHLLDGKLAQALVTLKERFELAHIDTQHAIDQIASEHPQAVADLQELLQRGDVAAVKQGLIKLKNRVHGTPLGELTQHLAQRRLPEAHAQLSVHPGIRSELKSTQYFRATWAKISIDKRVTQALDQAPKNAGPINSHLLVLRSLALMRDISPDYLNRLTTYVDTLLCLDEMDKQKPTNPRKTTPIETGIKSRSRAARGQSR
ncbi:DUF2894 domain-containing protein [Rhodoferax sp.]|uniref:DUF2894 domain-containing protein n=1 Tax=Rhodoferax sp. TaxID=50421 RepID=UPI00284D238A|nr:DUF2894 domain-containing protein [Rhodoferax sp.]MDR3369160.1 DUF2894 domain-containing protein [Rhodoferax sp.]